MYAESESLTTCTDTMWLREFPQLEMRFWCTSLLLPRSKEAERWRRDGQREGGSEEGSLVFTCDHNYKSEPTTEKDRTTLGQCRNVGLRSA